MTSTCRATLLATYKAQMRRLKSYFQLITNKASSSCTFLPLTPPPVKGYC